MLAATAFLQGVAAEELEARELDAYDPRYPVIVTARAVKRAAPATGAAREPRRDQALVSVVIPCHDQSDTLDEAIESVEAQTFAHVEVIVVDDGSTDDTAAVASRHAAVELIRQDNRGLPAARNAGLEAATGTFVVFLDADDRLLPNALATGVEALLEHPECAMVCGHHRTIAGDGSLSAQWPAFHPPGGHYYGLLQGNFVAAIHSAMFRREAFTTLGGFDTSFRAAEDYDLYLRLARRFPMHCHAVEVAEYRRRSSSMTGDPGLLLASTLAALRRQRPHLGRDRVLRGAYRAGVEWWREFYGSRLVAEVKSAGTAPGRRWRGVWLLARHHRRGLAALVTGAPAGAHREERRPAVWPPAASFDGPAEVLAWLTGELEHRDEILGQREQAIAWLEEKLAEARATIEARDAAVAWLQGRLEAAEAAQMARTDGARGDPSP